MQIASQEDVNDLSMDIQYKFEGVVKIRFHFAQQRVDFYFLNDLTIIPPLGIICRITLY